MKKLFLLLLIFILVPSVKAISIPSKSAILIDQESGRVLYSKNINEKGLIASTTKIMTAVLAIESGKLDDIVTVDDSVLESYGSGIYIKPGENISLRDLVYGLLLRSGNDAAIMIETYLGGHTHFIDLMNKKAKELGMKNTTFENSSGLDESGEENYSTVYDMALLMKYACNIPDFREIDSTKSYEVETNKNYYSWTNKNKLLFMYKYANGGKTGYTKKAKRTLVTSASKDDVNLIAVTFVDSDDFNTHKKLYEYGFSTYKKYLIINKNNLKIKGYGAYVKNNYYYLLKEGEYKNITTKAIINKKDNVLGYISVKYKDKEIHRETLFAK
ncbi:MAG: D-alanyl-D-alanine carboxypeptidase [Bacilli bacterium]|nr:D-alanyl-D-alanine carboxypeptidase [Bacilli bacterium]